MNPQEILPSPEKKNTPTDGSESSDVANEKESAKQVEQKSQAAKDGSGVVSASAVDDAKQKLQGVSQSDQGSDSDDNDDDQSVDMPEVAEDVDLIEKEWVKKAKDIVNATYGDPYTQNKQISKMKVEYIKKRYDRQIKTRDE